MAFGRWRCFVFFYHGGTVALTGGLQVGISVSRHQGRHTYGPTSDVDVHTFTGAGKVVEEWREAFCIPLDFERYSPYTAEDMWIALFHPRGYYPETPSSYSPRPAVTSFHPENVLRAFLSAAGTPAPGGHVAEDPAVTAGRQAAAATYSLDGYNSLSYAVDALNACKWNMVVTPTVPPPSAPQLPKLVAIVKRHHYSSVAEEIRAALAVRMPHLAAHLWKLQTV